MKGFERIVEERIREAQRKGELSGLPGEGRPLPGDDDAMVPEDQRMAMKVLRNAGYVPPGVSSLGEAQRLLVLCEEGAAGPARDQARKRLEVLLARIEQDGLVEVSRAMMVRYHAALLRRFER